MERLKYTSPNYYIMKIYTYFIYHIPGVKIGCTTDLEKRMNDQGFTEWDILWQQRGNYEFGWVAGDKEKELQELYGLPIDKNHYMIARNARLKGTLKAVETNRERGHMQIISTFESRSRGGKKSIANLSEEEKLRRASNGGKKGGKNGGSKPATQNSNMYQKWLCPGPEKHISNGINYKRWCINRGLDPNDAIRIS